MPPDTFKALHSRPPRPKKSLGQNFLVDRRVLGKIVDAADLSTDDVVLEIGPGRGFLTKALAERAGRVVAVEMDIDLVQHLREKLAEFRNVEIVQGDGREVDLGALVSPQLAYKVVANLPYYAATPIVRRFLEAEHKPTMLVVMLQREVAREMTAQPGKMGILSVATQLYGKPRIVTSVPPRAFRPAPNVKSAVVRIDVYETPAVAFESPGEFFRVVKAGFSAPRKQIRNNLKRGLDIDSDMAVALLSEAGIDPTRRAQTLNLDEWSRLFHLVETGT
jgi:16S rRNA (adenine1518-N6/adenine1519-N6)-dimethyltransferase